MACTRWPAHVGLHVNQNGASTFNTANQLLEDANFTYQYDNNGNQTRKTAKVGGAVTQYEYDAEKKLVRVVSPTNTANYKYDGLGRRVEKEVITGTTTVTKYVYDNEDILLELNGSSQIVARYTHGPGIDEPLIMEKNNQSFYYHADGIGSITEMTNQAGAVVQRYTYSSFGKIKSQLDPSLMQPFSYSGREFDAETGLYYYRARYYDAQSGRFLGEDPKRSLTIDGMAGDDFNLTMTLRRLQNGYQPYVYALNDPVSLIDPDGRFGILAAVVGVAVTGITIYAAVDTLLSWAQPNYRAREQAMMDATDGKPGAEQRAQHAQEEIAKAAAAAGLICRIGRASPKIPTTLLTPLNPPSAPPKGPVQ